MRQAAFTFVLTMCLVAPLGAEVSDKEPTVLFNWVWAIIGSGASIVAWRWRWWAGAPVSAIALLGLWAVYAEISDPSIASSIRATAPGYVSQFFAAAALVLLFQVVAVYSCLKRRRASR